MDVDAKISGLPRPARWPIQFLIGLVCFIAGSAVVLGILLGALVVISVVSGLLRG